MTLTNSQKKAIKNYYNNTLKDNEEFKEKNKLRSREYYKKNKEKILLKKKVKYYKEQAKINK